MAEGTPAELKRSLGNDVIFVQMDGYADEAKAAVSNVDGVVDVDASGGELIIHVVNGAAHISDVALALNAHNVQVTELTLRTPTLDDVFLSVAGARMEQDAE